MIISGLDIHKSRVWVHMLDDKGNTICEQITERNPDGLETLRHLHQQYQVSKVVMESTSSYWIPVYRQLESVVAEKCVVNAYQMKLLGRHKTDERDAKRLAEWGLLNVLNASFIPTMEIHELRQLVRSRAKIMNQRSSVITSLKTLLEGICPGLTSSLKNLDSKYVQHYLHNWRKNPEISDFLSFLENIPHRATRKALIKRIDVLGYWWQHPLTDVQQHLLDLKMRQIQFYSEELKMLDMTIVHYVEISGLNKAVKLMTTIPGLGIITASTIAAELGSVERFNNPREAAASCGLTPKLSGSAGKTRAGRITKHGPKSVRRATYIVCKTVIRFSPYFQQFYLRIKQNKAGSRSAGRIAMVALSRKIVEMCWLLWSNNTPFKEPQQSKMR